MKDALRVLWTRQAVRGYTAPPTGKMTHTWQAGTAPPAGKMTHTWPTGTAPPAGKSKRRVGL